ncbi:MAG: HD domain-containing protein [Anaerolineae bacterium]|nr:HD domain-containing protein [Anaerolineae bacterium]
MQKSIVSYADPIYGDFHLTDPLLVDLYHSRAVQRLKHIHQGGITAFIKPSRKTTRFEHSLGVTSLLHRLGAGIEEQAAGLVHDVAHTAFSHVIDFVFPNKEHDYHEKNSARQILGSDLPHIATKHQLDWHHLTDSSRYTLLEQPLPRLCADRLDYFLRDGVVDVCTFSAQDARAFLHHVRSWKGEIVIDDLDAARWLGEQFIILDQVCWCSVQEVGWYGVMANALKIALAHEIISENDLQTTDSVVMETLKTAHNKDVDRWLNLLRIDVDFERVCEHPDLVTLPKVRAVDPPVLQKGTVVPLSTLDHAFALHRDKYVKSKQGVWKLRIIEPQTPT